MNALEMITGAIDKFNRDEKQELVSKNTKYLEDFKTNNHEEEYQAYVNKEGRSE